MVTTIKIKKPVSSFSLYDFELKALREFELKARAYAKDQGHSFTGLSFDVDSDGYVHVYADGLDSIRL